MSVKGFRHGIMWFRDVDLRLNDNLALFTAHYDVDAVSHVYCFDPRFYQQNKETLNERVSFRRLRFLVESINDLSRNLRSKGGSLHILIGLPEVELVPLIDSSTTAIYCTEQVTSEEMRVQTTVSRSVALKNVTMKPYWSGTLVDRSDLPMPLSKLDIFTSFRKTVEAANCINKPCIEQPLLKPDLPTRTSIVQEELDPYVIYEKIMAVLDLPLTYDLSAINTDVRGFKCIGGESAALDRLEYYCQIGLVDCYKRTRNGLIGGDYSTKLSPWLALGCISARTVLHRVQTFEKSTGIANEDTYWVIFELLWRDYMRFYALKYGNKLFKLYGVQGTAAINKHPWRKDLTLFNAWCTGNTGYPFIDANMKELMLTGFMSNRGRQNVASFLVRDLGLDWRLGALHFERYLLDYDPCSNYGNWQYAAGVGSDPREDRYFNIVKQASMYDPDCAFIRLWCPDIARLPNNILKNPRLLTTQLRIEYRVTQDILPDPIAPLLHGEFREETSSRNNSRQQNHGGVPGASKGRK